MFKFIHAADIHLDSPLRGLERYEGAPVEKIRLATREALENLVRLAIRERVQCLVLAGDLYDGDWKDYNTGLYMVSQFTRLREAGIPVYLISGNHDADNKMTRKLPFPDNVHVFRTDAPETVLLEDHGVALHGQGFATAKVTDDISRNYPQADPRFYNIGLLHTCATGREGHETYAPCTLEGLRIKEYDYWALGHIHQREILHAREPLVVFPGNLQGRHIRETGAKGCLLVTVDHQQRTTYEFHPLDVFRWELCSLDATEFGCRDDLVEQFTRRLESLIEAADGKPLAIRTEITGASPLHDQLTADRERWLYELRAIAIQEGREQLWLEKLKIRTTPPQSDEPQPDGPLGELLQVIAEIRHDPELLRTIGGELDDLHKKIPPTLQADFRLTDPVALLETLDRVEGLLAGRLLSRVED